MTGPRERPGVSPLGGALAASDDGILVKDKKNCPFDSSVPADFIPRSCTTVFSSFILILFLNMFWELSKGLAPRRTLRTPGRALPCGAPEEPGGGLI